MSETNSVEREVRQLCSHCRFPLPSSTSGLRHYGLHTAHQENECLRLLHSEIDRLTKERDEWAAKWQAERRKYAELRWPGLNGEVRALGPNAGDERAA